jgi:histone-lysine N-methyltransferase SETMAR
VKLRDAIRRKYPGQLARGVLLQHNARSHTARANRARIQEIQWELLEHPPYSPDLAPSDFNLSGPVKNNPDGKRFPDDVVIETEVRKWLRQQSKDFCAAAFNLLVKRWDKCINVGECREMVFFFFTFEYHVFYVLYPSVTSLLTLPLNSTLSLSTPVVVAIPYQELKIYSSLLNILFYKDRICSETRWCLNVISYIV